MRPLYFNGIDLLTFEKEYDGKLSFATDAWTSPNHKAYVAITGHLEHEGKPLTMLLDIVEVAKSHTGVNLASAFSDILKSFGIDEKVSHVQLKKFCDGTHLQAPDSQCNC